MKTPIPPVRELCAQTLQLCHAVQDAVVPEDLRAKAGMVERMIHALYNEEPVSGGPGTEHVPPPKYDAQCSVGKPDNPAPSPSDDITDLL